MGSYFKNSTAAGETLVERWNGTAWKVQPSPNVDPSHDTNGLSDVARHLLHQRLGGGQLWRPGSAPDRKHWNGKTWTIQPSSSFTAGSLFSVAAISSSDAWAVGSYFDGTTSSDQNLILHCC